MPEFGFPGNVKREFPIFFDRESNPPTLKNRSREEGLDSRDFFITTGTVNFGENFLGIFSRKNPSQNLCFQKSSKENQLEFSMNQIS